MQERARRGVLGRQSRSLRSKEELHVAHDRHCYYIVWSLCSRYCQIGLLRKARWYYRWAAPRQTYIAVETGHRRQSEGER